MAASLRHDAFLRLSEAVLRLRLVLARDVVLLPATGIGNLAALAARAAADLIVTDAPFISQLGGRTGNRALSRAVEALAAIKRIRPPVPMVILAPDFSREFPVLRAGGRVTLVVIEEMRSAGALGWKLAPVLFPSFPTPFLSVLPEALTADEEMGLTAGAFGAERPAGLSELARRCACDEHRLLWNLSHVSIGEPLEVDGAVRAWSVLESIEAGVVLSRAVCAAGFGSYGSFARTCVQLTGVRVEALQAHGGSTRLLECLSDRWTSVSGCPISGEGRLEGKAVAGSAAREVLADLYQRFWRNAWEGAKGRGTSDEQAEDAAQQVFLKLLTNGPESWARRLTGAFFWQAGRNEADHLMRRKDEAHEDLWDGIQMMGAELSSEPSHADGHEHAERAEEVRTLLGSLPEPRRAVLRLDTAGWTTAEIADVLGKERRQVVNLRHRAKRAMKFGGMQSGEANDAAG